MKRDQKILEYITLTIATIILDVGVYFFKFPNNFSFGGVTGLAVVLSQVTALRASTLNFVINMVLLVFGFLFLGRGFGIKTVYVSVLSSLGLSLLDVFCPMQGPLTSQPVLELIYAIVLPAFSSAILFNVNASGGGTDIIAMIVNRYKTISYGRIIMLCDLLIIGCSIFIFKNITAAIYGYVMVAVNGYTIDAVMAGNRQSTQVLIVSKKYEEIARLIFSEMRRGVTLLDGEGWYTKQPTKVVMVVCRKYETGTLFKLIKRVDPEAFMTVGNVMGVYGHGFEALKK